MVTGAGGDIGGACTLRLADEGAGLILIDRKIGLLDDIAQRCRELGAQVWTGEIDQSKHC